MSQPFSFARCDRPRFVLMLCAIVWGACSSTTAPRGEPPPQPPPARPSPNHLSDATTKSGDALPPADAAAPPNNAQGPAATPTPPLDPKTRHASCKLPLRAARPLGALESQLSVNTTAMNAFRGLNCDQVPALPRCDDSTPCPYAATCAKTSDDAQGYCIEGGEASAPLAYRDGVCAIYATAAQRAALCCAKVQGVDCAPWPHDKPSAPGGICAADAECEPGLVCLPTSYANGRCACPRAPKPVENPPQCGGSSVPSLWGTVPKELAVGACEAATAEGFVLDVLGKAGQGVRGGSSSLSLAHDSRGALYAAFAGPAFAEIFTDAERVPPGLTQLPDVRGMHHYRLAFPQSVSPGNNDHEPPFAWAIGPDDVVQVMGWSKQRGLFVERLTDPPGRKVKVPTSRGVANPMLHISANGRRVIAMDDAAEGVGVDRETDAGFDFRFAPFERGQTYLEGIVAWPPGQTRVLYSEAGANGALYDPEREVAERFVTPEPESKAPSLPSTASPLGAAARGQDLYVALRIWDTDPYYKLAIEHLRADGTRERELLWDPHARGSAEWPQGSVVLDADGRPHVVVLLPGGITWFRRGASGAWTSSILTTERGVPHAGFARDGKLEVYYRGGAELRRLREAACSGE